MTHGSNESRCGTAGRCLRPGGTSSKSPRSCRGDDIDTHYGTDLRDLALNATEIEEPPGRDWLYNNFNALLIGLVLERATGTPVSDFMANCSVAVAGAGRPMPHGA